MLIDPKEIDKIEDIGTIDKKKTVKLVKTIGGLHLAIGKEREYEKEKILAFASHPAIVKFQLERKYTHRYHSALNKSEQGVAQHITPYSHNLPHSLINSGYDIFCMTKGEETEFIVTKDNMEFLKTSISTDSDNMQNGEVTIKNREIYDEFAQNDGKTWLSRSVAEYLVGK